MLFFRVLLFAGALALGVCLLGWGFTRDHRWLRLAMLCAGGTALLALVFFAGLFAERLG